MEKFSFFSTGPFSQWYESEFIVNGTLFNCAEQFMMASKALIFNDMNIYNKVMASSSPKEHKRLGRLVENFDKSKWDKVARSVVYRGNIAKFSQNPRLCSKLVATKGTTLVEATFDKIWGIGLKQFDPKAENRTMWLGANWLGETLTLVRDHIMKGIIGKCLYCSNGLAGNESCNVYKNILSLNASSDLLIEIKDCIHFDDSLKF
jgi:hypothetical protein